ncbi:MAG: 50S ribosomal protein L29 [Chloroflexi bacterium]|nr:MAG: 50S ribosomal protein L29 [Phototrophicales bacterium]RMF82417.1 MAG: 50S ribosomal protein L29 [Chloroflexota bacterium]
MDVREIRRMSDEEILEVLEEQKRGLFNLRFESVTGEVTDTNSLRRARRDVARLMTVLRERQLAAEVVSEDEDGE